MDAETVPSRSNHLRRALAACRGAWSRATHLALDIALPTLCVACREPVDGEGVCAACWAKLSFIEPPYCPRLGIPFVYDPGPELLSRAALVPSDDVSAPVAELPILPEAITQRPRRPKRSKPWFEEVFDEDYLRTLPFMRADQTLREVEFIADALRVGPGAEILDIACGYGRHAIELVQRGYNVTGLDLSLPLLRDRVVQLRGEVQLGHRMAELLAADRRGEREARKAEQRLHGQ